jgi:predicted DNA-binding WGR domain protein
LEADYVASLILGLLGREDRPSLGIVAFSEAQQTEIESALSRLAEADKEFADRLEAEYEREIDGQFSGLLIKNLENIQGDERDVIILSVCYGRGPDGKMRMNFGPINQSGGEKRLNVAFSRAKRNMAVVSSIRHTEITNDYNDGANCLKNYLQYAEACSAGDSTASHRVLHGLAVWKDLEPAPQTPPAAFVQQIAAALTERGYAVDLAVGMSHFRCDIAVRRHGDPQYCLGVLVDTEEHYEQDDLLEREMLRPQLLRDFGWRIAHVLARDWYVDRKAVMEHLMKMIEHRQETAAEPDGPEEDIWGELDGANDLDVDREMPSGVDLGEDEHSGQAVEVENNSAAQPPQNAPITTSAGPFKRYFEFIGGSSRKFWEIQLSSTTVTVRFGRIGGAGQTQVKVFADKGLAARTAQRLIAEKLGKGYVEQKELGAENQN